jgi:HEAT repeat protein
VRFGYPPSVPCRFARASSLSRLASGLLLLALAASLASGCAGTPRGRVLAAIDARKTKRALVAYEVFRREEEPDGALLARIAALMLEQAAQSSDARLRDAALSQLVLAGTAGRDGLRAISELRGHEQARATALVALARSGDDDAREALRGMLGDDDPDVHAAAVRVLDVQAQRAALREALADTRSVVRAAAADALRGAAPDAAVRVLLAETARLDPEPRVRVFAVRALGAFGPAAVEPLRERLSDADASVRTAAVAALVEADRTAARLALVPLFGLGPSTAGIDAARFLARPSADDARATVDARAYLLRTLELGDAMLRGSAALVLASLPSDPSLDETLLRVLEHDADPNVRLQLASALARPTPAEGPRDTAVHARALLVGLLPAGGMVGAQAAATLAAAGEVQGARALRALLSDADPAIRRVAARALARDALSPDAARRALRDRDPTVRIAAAGGILAAHAQR